MDWFYHAPGEGRAGPFSADELRRRYRERRIQRDTLVWREGLPEWQALERVADELDLFSVTPDTSLPPPLPAAPRLAMAPAMAAGGMPAGPGRSGARAQPAPRRMNGCLVAFIVLAVVSLPLLGIVGAIAVPAYQDYVLRAKLAAWLEPRAVTLRMGLQQARQASGRCPEQAQDVGLDAAEGLRLGELEDGRCAFEITVQGVDPKVDGRTLLYIAPPAPGGAWDCTGGDLPSSYRAAACRASASDVTP